MKVTVAQWVEALRSGKYRKSVGMMKHGKGYDAWGVLCDLLDPSWNKDNTWGRTHSKWFPPQSILEQLADLRRQSIKDHRAPFAIFCDRAKTFTPVADYIEKVLDADMVIEIED